MADIQRRLDHLERETTAGGCPACGPPLFGASRPLDYRLAVAPLAPLEIRAEPVPPAPCPQCGRPPIWIEAYDLGAEPRP